ncbi:MAG: cysteine desulfurase family protein [Oligoflexia bacterium]|nr:cysteine desulfurase family protein [Oligoflexia bacterium]
MERRTAIYLDANAGAPLKPAAIAAIRPLLNSEDGLLPNPSSIHAHGRKAKRWVAEAREKIAASLGSSVDPEQLVFTSSGTEANQLAIRSVLEARLEQGGRPHWILSPIEHDSTLQLVDWLVKRGGGVSFLPVDAQGRIEVSRISDLFRPETALVSVVWVNNETGVIADIPALIQETERRKITLHLDAAQAWGKLPLDLGSLGADLVTFSGHKIGALAGIGLVSIRRGTALHGLIRGKQEKGRRGGTENLLGIVSMGAAAQDLDPVAWTKRVSPLRDRLQSVIRQRPGLAGVQINGEEAPRVANTLSLSFEGVGGDGLVMALDLAGYSVSAGSACSSGVLEPSHVLLAMGRTKAQAVSAIRVSLVDEVPLPVLDGFADALEKVVVRARKSAATE